MPQAAKADSITAPGSQTLSGSHPHDIALVNLWRCEGRLRALALMLGAYLADKEDKMLADALADLVEVEADFIKSAADHIHSVKPSDVVSKLTGGQTHAQ
ncbi:hypothetical protein SAMN05421890_1273 [Ensifer adhaerens]|nr:hypothetical protein SAMN05421890_1273 [Ensifer adhaerens]